MKERTWTIGSLPDCDIRVDSPVVSGRHCRLTQRGQTFLLEDLASTNGTFAAGERIDRPRSVRRGEKITLGLKLPMPWPNLSTITVGRLPDNDVVIPLDMVSGHHARLEREGNRVFLVDLDSRNGTVLNDPVKKIRARRSDRPTPSSRGRTMCRRRTFWPRCRKTSRTAGTRCGARCWKHRRGPAGMRIFCARHPWARRRNPRNPGSASLGSRVPGRKGSGWARPAFRCSLPPPGRFSAAGKTRVRTPTRALPNRQLPQTQKDRRHWPTPCRKGNRQFPRRRGRPLRQRNSTSNSSANRRRASACCASAAARWWPSPLYRLGHTAQYRGLPE